VRSRAQKAWELQLQERGKSNADLKGKQLEETCLLHVKDQVLVEQAIQHWGLSARAYHRILRVARTIADLAGSPQINTEHLTEALSYRCFERQRFS
jgi:magnesium chelatase family protein